MAVKQELVFIPIPAIGHMVPTMRMAKLLTDRDERLSITVLVMKSPVETETTSYSSSSRIRLIKISLDHPSVVPKNFDVLQFIEDHKDLVRDNVAKIASDESTRLAAFVVDMFCTTMIDVANEFGVPTYVSFVCGASMLGFALHVQCLHDEQNKDVTASDDVELLTPTHKIPVPKKVFPTGFLDKEGLAMSLNIARGIRKTKGIMINTFMDLEDYALKALADDGKIPPVYPIGPILHVDEENKERKEIIKWLDEQPVLSVVFLCFGSTGCFDVDQVKEIAVALEQSGHRFLWSLRKPPPKDRFEHPSEYDNFEEVLPEGFLQRTAGIGKVLGWVPQVSILSHPSVGGFVTHCGWNSTLESIWYGVPIAAWPMFADQQLIAFKLVKELGIGVEIKMDYRIGSDVVVKAEEIERGIKCVMEPESETRMKLKEMKDKTRMALLEGGSSYDALGCFIDNVIDSI